MSEVFYWTGVLLWAFGGVGLASALLWHFAVMTIANAGNLAEFAKFSAMQRQRRRSSEEKV